MPPRLSSAQQATLFRSAGLGNLANGKKPATSGSFSALTTAPKGTGGAFDKVEISKVARQASTATALQQNAPTAKNQTTTAASTPTNQNSAPSAETKRRTAPKVIYCPLVKITGHLP